MKDKKRMLRLLIEDMTLTKGDTVHIDIRFVGGATRRSTCRCQSRVSCCARPMPPWCRRSINWLIPTRIKKIADLLNERGVRWW